MLDLFTRFLCLKQNAMQGQVLRRIKLIWIEFSFFLTDWDIQAKEPSLLYNLHIAGGGIARFMLLPTEMQTASSRIWTRVTVSIS